LLLISCTKSQNRLKAGQNAPDFSLYTPEKEKISIKNYNGKYLLIHFWADWCSQCRAEFPKLENSYQKMHNQNFEIIGINAGQSAEHVSEFVKYYNLTFPMVLDEVNMKMIMKLAGKMKMKCQKQ
jgi:peroxiredoxin